MSPRPFIRNLTFQSNNLGKEVRIMLAWEPNLEGLYDDVFPIVWKVSKFGKTGPYRAQLTYTNQLAFSRAQDENGKVISAETSVTINTDQKTTLTEANEVYQFSPPQAGTSGILQAVNNTGTVQDIALGFLNKGELIPTPTLFFSDVGDSSRVTAKFTPVLHAYIASDYDENSILRGQIDTPAIWSQDLTALVQNTTWNLTRDPNSGRYTINHA
ncbi:uncharacterized protein EDB93DRAFT_1102562 [Suillus bovinus]|uniref:uncharacterized protein n=1 Tax=Suillus bovinus TaxID=48563 RepID=UPI001B86303B|nr:uncharacterized protein EDB93DRAFT_1102562 [Suillus bovinus]KAG2153758.1 hypothetical protein EDB93DRAFT_1102562 [Suillus bovinus]